MSRVISTCKVSMGFLLRGAQGRQEPHPRSAPSHRHQVRGCEKGSHPHMGVVVAQGLAFGGENLQVSVGSLLSLLTCSCIDSALLPAIYSLRSNTQGREKVIKCAETPSSLQHVGGDSASVLSLLLPGAQLRLWIRTPAVPPQT